MLQGKKIIIAGGSGFVGSAMAESWARDNHVVVLSRQQQKKVDNSYGKKEMCNSAKYVKWDGRTLGDWVKEIEGCDILINLAGKSVNCRYTEANKAEIFNSRTDATTILGAAIKQTSKPPSLWINGGSATIYRHATDKPQDEYTGEMHNDFSVQVCKAWEQSFNVIELPDTRKVILRMAIVFGKGGVLVPYSRLVKFGLGGKQGNGKQMFSWIHIADLISIVEWLYKNNNANGTYNASAPHPVSNNEMMHEIRKCLGIPFGLPAPAWLLKIGAQLIGTETELLLKSRWVVPARLLKEGYTFKYPSLPTALKDILQKKTVLYLSPKIKTI